MHGQDNMDDMRMKLKASEVTNNDIIHVVTSKQCHKMHW